MDKYLPSQEPQNRSQSGERDENYLFLPIRQPERTTAFGDYGRLPKVFIPILLHSSRKTFQMLAGLLKNSVLFLLKQSSLGQTGEVFPRAQNSSQEGKCHILFSSVDSCFLLLMFNCCATKDKKLYLTNPQFLYQCSEKLSLATIREEGKKNEGRKKELFHYFFLNVLLVTTPSCKKWK